MKNYLQILVQTGKRVHIKTLNACLWDGVVQSYDDMGIVIKENGEIVIIPFLAISSIRVEK